MYKVPSDRKKRNADGYTVAVNGAETTLTIAAGKYGTWLIKPVDLTKHITFSGKLSSSVSFTIEGEVGGETETKREFVYALGK